MDLSNGVFELFLGQGYQPSNFSRLIRSMKLAYPGQPLFILQHLSQEEPARLVFKGLSRCEWIFSHDIPQIDSSPQFVSSLSEKKVPSSKPQGRILMIVGYHHEGKPWAQQSTWYRVLGVGQALEMYNYHVTYVSISTIHAWMPLFETQDWTQILFHRVAAGDDFSRVLKMARSKNIPTIMDLDDLVFDETILWSHFACLEMSLRQRRELKNYIYLQQEAISECDRFLVSTEDLQKVGRKYNDSVEVRWNWIPDFYASFLSLEENQKKEVSSLRIFYGAGSLEHQYFFRLIEKSLKKLFMERQNISLILGGGLSIPCCLQPFSQRIHRLPKLIPEAYFSILSEVDIALAPLGQDPFSQSKSWIKGLEALAVGTLWMATENSNFSYLKQIYPSTGVIVEDPSEWFSSIEKIIDQKYQEIHSKKQIKRDAFASAHVAEYILS